MTDSLSDFLQEYDLARSLSPQSADPQATRQWVRWIAAAGPDEIARLLAGLLVHESPPTGSAAEKMCIAALELVAQRVRRGAVRFDAELYEALERLYRHLDAMSVARPHLLSWLAWSGDAESLERLTQLLASDPPEPAERVAMALSPLFHSTDWDAAALVPRVLDVMAQPNCAAAVLELTNHIARAGLLPRHPLAEQAERLRNTLSALIRRLQEIEKTPPISTDDQVQTAQIVEDSTELICAISDALALIGDTMAASLLADALEISHRRIQSEAAAALARLKDERGLAAMISLAGEPVARLRILSYAEEMGILDQMPEEYRSEDARVEGEVALCLAQPTLYGLPPSRMEVIDRRWQYWPGFDEAQHCVLIRYTYETERASFENIAITGPLTHALPADLTALSWDDVYAIYAGWQTEHEEIRVLDVSQLAEHQRVEVSRLERRLRDSGYILQEAKLLGYFFGERVLIANVMAGDVDGLALADSIEASFVPVLATGRPLQPNDLFDLYKGRRLLRSFNA